LISVRDTAKHDIIIVIAGAVAVFLFIWLYSDFHPLSSADNSLGNNAAERQAQELLGSYGFRSDYSPVTRFQAQSTLLDSIQVETNFNEFYQNPLNRSLYPVFFWRTEFLIEREDVGFQLGIPGTGANTISVLMSESGELIGMINDNDILPSKEINFSAFSHALGFDIQPAMQARTDTSAQHRTPFIFTGRHEAEIDSAAIQARETVFLGIAKTEKLAKYHFERSNWPVQHFEIKSTEIVSVDEQDAALVVFTQTNPQLNQNVSVGVRVLPDGNLLSMEYSFDQGETVDGVITVMSGLRAMFYLFTFFWIIILLFMRFRMRLIDTKAAILVAVLAGLVFPFILLLQQLHSHIHSFGTIDLSFILMAMIPVGFIAAITSIGFFTVTAIADSITRQNWPDKLRTVDLLRVGHFVNIPVGLNLVRGISYGLIVALLWCLSLIYLPNSAITVSESFNGDSTYLPFISEVLGNFAIYFLVAQVVFLIFVGQIISNVKSPFLLIAAPAVIFILLYPFSFEVGTVSTELITAGVAGIALGWIYWREDFLTAFIALFIFATLISTSPGWLISSSPDISSFIVFLSVALIGYIFGGYNILKGKPVRELPDFVPEYIQELAREDRIKQELQIARKVQNSFLPDKTPEVEGLEVAAICKAAYETGGDYYDFIELNDKKLAITVGDVSGKGIEAAFYMTFTKGVLHALFHESGSTIDVLSKTNKLFRQNANRGTFISLIFGIFDKERSTFCFSRAGHNPLLYYSKKQKKLFEYQPNGIAIGMADEEIFRKHISEQKIQLSEGDILILFTDGVVESISKTNKVYGDSRLHNLIKRNFDASPEELIKKFEQDLERFGEKTEQHDDMTMVIIKKKG